MKKLNTKGFTLIELLAVITIMGILMVVAIPTVSRSIENSRKDTFLNTVNQYVSGVRNMWAADSLICEGFDGSADYVSSAVPEGLYYVEVQTKSSSVPVLLEQGGKSSWGSRDIAGYILVAVDDVQGNDGVSNRNVSYYPVLVDGVHGINITSDGVAMGAAWSGSSFVASAETGINLTRADIEMSGGKYTIVASSMTGNALTQYTEISQPNGAKKCVEV